MIDLIKQHRKPLLIGLCLLTATGYYYYKKQDPIFTGRVEKVPQLTYHQKYQLVLHEVQHLLTHHKHTLHKDILFIIYKGKYSLANQQLRTQVEKSRKQRRNLIKDPASYAKVVLELQQQLQLILDKHLATILDAFVIDRATFTSQIDRFSELTNQIKGEWEELKKQKNEELILSMRDKYRKPKTFSQVKTILHFQIKKLEVLQKEEIGLDADRGDEEKLIILTTYLKDIVFEKFGVEEQRLKHSISLLSAQQIQQIEESHEKISKLCRHHLIQDIQFSYQRLESQYF